jgi:hypothetical protein
MRTLWLEDQLFGEPLVDLAASFDEIARRSQAGDPSAREALLTVAVLLAKKADSAFLWALGELAKEGTHPHLERLVRADPDRNSLPPDPSVPIRQTRIINDGNGRELTVGERRSLARRPSRLQVLTLLQDPHPLVIEQLLSCPSLTEADVVQFATRRPASAAALGILVSSPRWIIRRRVRMSLILNPSTPHGLALPFVSTATRDDLQLIAGTTTVSSTLRDVARELYHSLPPFADNTPA